MSAPIMHAAILPPCRSAVRAHSSQSAAQTLPARRIVRDVNEAARDVARALAKTEVFAHLKRILRLARLRLRGPSGAQFEFTLAAIAQNLKRLANLCLAHHRSRPWCAWRKLQCVPSPQTPTLRPECTAKGSMRLRLKKLPHQSTRHQIRLLQQYRANTGRG